jgi:hypothetical protein
MSATQLDQRLLWTQPLCGTAQVRLWKFGYEHNCNTGRFTDFNEVLFYVLWLIHRHATDEVQIRFEQSPVEGLTLDFLRFDLTHTQPSSHSARRRNESRRTPKCNVRCRP